MRRLIHCLVLVAACEATAGSWTDPERDGGAIDSAPMDAGDETPARYFGRVVVPLLELRCGACHAAGGTGPAFMAAPVYETVLAHPGLIDLRAPASSLLLTMGVHTGPAWDASEAAPILVWIQREAEADPPPEPTARATPPQMIMPGANTIPLSAAHPELVDAEIAFVAERVGIGMLLDDIRIVAGPTGLRATQLTVVLTVDGVDEHIDRYDSLDVRVDPDDEHRLDGLSLVPFQDETTVSFAFEDLAPLVTGVPSEPRCQAVAGFTEHARGPLMSACAGCHAIAGAPEAAAFDLTALMSGNDRALCNEVLRAVPPATRTTSAVWSAPDPAAAPDHPFKFATAEELMMFRDALSAWLAME